VGYFGLLSQSVDRQGRMEDSRTILTDGWDERDMLRWRIVRVSVEPVSHVNSCDFGMDIDVPFEHRIREPPTRFSVRETGKGRWSSGVE
jgi:hypothetical protein